MRNINSAERIMLIHSAPGGNWNVLLAWEEKNNQCPKSVKGHSIRAEYKNKTE